MDDETNQAATTAQVGDVDSSSGGGGDDPWATAAVVDEGDGREEEPPGTTVTHSQGETFTMPQTDTASTTNTHEFLAAMSNLGSVISAKAREVDQRTGISTKVADVNEKYHVSEKWGNLTTATKQKTHEINEKYHVADKWSNLTSSVAARVEQIKEDRRKRLEETEAVGGSNNNNYVLARENVIKSLNVATTWVSQRIQGIRAAGSLDENDARGAELPERK
jgi:hypothetical protein